MQGENTAFGIELALQGLSQLFVAWLGNRKVASSDGTTPMTGAQKKDHAVSQIAATLIPLAEAGATVVAANQANPLTKAAIETAVQTEHAALLASGEIQDTATLNAQPGPVVPPLTLPTPPQPPTSTSSPSA